MFTSDLSPTVKNGRLAVSGGIRVEAGKTLYLDSTVTVAADTTVANSARVLVSNGNLNLDGAAIHLQSAGSATLLDFVGETPMLGGTGEVLFEGNGANNWVRPITANAVLTIDSGIVIHGPKSGLVGTETLSRVISVVNKGRITAEVDGGAITVQGSVVRNEGVLEALAAGTLSLNTLINAGLLNAGVGGLINISGQFTQTSAGVVQIGIAGVSAIDFGRFGVSGLASLDGTIKSVLFDGFTPVLGQTFRVLTYGSKLGTFATVEDGNPDDGVAYSAVYDTGGVSLLVIA